MRAINAKMKGKKPKLVGDDTLRNRRKSLL